MNYIEANYVIVYDIRAHCLFMPSPEVQSLWNEVNQKLAPDYASNQQRQG